MGIRQIEVLQVAFPAIFRFKGAFFQEFFDTTTGDARFFEVTEETAERNLKLSSGVEDDGNESDERTRLEQLLGFEIATWQWEWFKACRDQLLRGRVPVISWTDGQGYQHSMSVPSNGS